MATRDQGRTICATPTRDRPPVDLPTGKPRVPRRMHHIRWTPGGKRTRLRRKPRRTRRRHIR
jgi:hypothetical protein